MGGRVLRAASLPLAALGLIGLGLRISLAVRPDASHDGRTAAMAAAMASTAALAAAWFIERVQAWRGEQAKRATLMAHADPLAARVDGLAAKMAETSARVDAVESKTDMRVSEVERRISALSTGLTAAFTAAARPAPAEIEMETPTAPMMRLVRRNASA
jgi:hypothetical protein